MDNNDLDNNTTNEDVEVLNTDLNDNEFNVVQDNTLNNISTESEQTKEEGNIEEGNIFDNTVTDNTMTGLVNNESISSSDEDIENVSNEINNMKYETNSDYNAINDVLNQSQIKKKKHILPIIIILLVVALVGAGVWYYLHINKTETIITSITNTVFDKFTSNIEEVKKFDITEKSILVNADMSLKTDIQSLKDLNSLKLNFTYGMDYKNKEIQTGLQINEDNKKLIDALAYVLNDNIYVLLKDDYPNIINIGKTNISDLFNTSNISIDDIKYIIDKYKDIFLKSLNMDDFIKSDDKITLNGSEVSVKKLTYVFDQDKYKKLINNMMDLASKDNELINKLAKVSGTDASSIENSLKNSNISDSTSIYINPVTFNIYIKGLKPELVGIDIVDSLEMRINDDVTTIKTKILNEDALITIKEDKDVIKADLQTKIDNKDLKITMDITSNKTDDNNYSGILKLVGIYDNQNMEFDINYKLTIGAKISDIDISKAKTMNTISQEELNNIEQKIGMRLYDSKIFKMIESLIPKNSTSLTVE